MLLCIVKFVLIAMVCFVQWCRWQW